MNSAITEMRSHIIYHVVIMRREETFVELMWSTTCDPELMTEFPEWINKNNLRIGDQNLDHTSYMPFIGL